jgi:hypothetical protein
VPPEENVEKPEDKEKLKLERDALLSSKVNIYFPKLRKVSWLSCCCVTLFFNCLRIEEYFECAFCRFFCRYK